MEHCRVLSVARINYLPQPQPDLGFAILLLAHHTDAITKNKNQPINKLKILDIPSTQPIPLKIKDHTINHIAATIT